jgi:hypothetical protein
VAIFDADATDYVDNIVLRGNTYNTTTQIYLDATDYTSPQLVTDTFTAHDCSGYNNIVGQLYLVATTSGDVDITAFEVQCYYDT